MSVQVKSRKGYQGCLASLEIDGGKKSLLEPGVGRIPPEYTESIREGCIGQLTHTSTLNNNNDNNNNKLSKFAVLF